MRQTVLALAILLAAAPALAQPPAPRWVLEAPGTAGAIYVDLASISRSGGLLNISLLLVSRKPQDFLGVPTQAIQMAYVVDCAARTSRLVTVGAYDADDRMLKATTVEEEFLKIDPGAPPDFAALHCATPDRSKAPAFANRAAAIKDGLTRAP